MFTILRLYFFYIPLHFTSFVTLHILSSLQFIQSFTTFSLSLLFVLRDIIIFSINFFLIVVYYIYHSVVSLLHSIFLFITPLTTFAPFFQYSLIKFGSSQVFASARHFSGNSQNEREPRAALFLESTSKGRLFKVALGNLYKSMY